LLGTVNWIELMGRVVTYIHSQPRQVKELHTQHMYRRLALRRGRFLYNNVLCSIGST
jgi:hypothetical protein